MSDNPYDAPAASVADADEWSEADAQALRREHLGREASLRVVGVLCGAFGTFFVLLFFGYGMDVLRRIDSASPREGVVLLLVAALGILGMVANHGLLHLRSWGRGPVAAIALSLALTAVLAPLALHAAWLTFSHKGLRVLSPTYGSVRARARHLHAWTRPVEALLLSCTGVLNIGALWLMR